MTSTHPPTAATPSQPPLLAAKGLSAGYGRVPAIENIDFQLAVGEIVALLGANASGKTTTLLALAGVLEPMAGTVSWLGKVVRSPLHIRARQGLGFVLGDRGTIGGLSTADNLRLGMGSLEQAVELFPELQPLMKRKAGLLSGGEQKILALARALASRPRALLVDELSLGLAPNVLDRILAALREASQRGVGVVLVEQQVVHALQFADRAYILRRGQIIMRGATSDLLDRIDEIETSYLVT